MAMLDIQGLGKTFGGLNAIDALDFHIDKGEIVSVIGPNGAGKTTFYNAVSGHFRPTRGRVYFDGRDITGMPAHKLVPKGLLRSFQVTNIFPNLTVIENILVPLVLHTGRGYSFWGGLSKEKTLHRKAEEILDKVGILDSAYRTASELPYGDKRLVEMAIVLAREPKLVMLDEPTAGMNPEETERMIRLIKELADRFGTTFFLTEHDMKVVFAVASQIYVLHQGGLLAQGDQETIRSDPKVREAYLGGSVND